MSLFFRKIDGGPEPLLVLHGVFGSSDNWLTISKHIASSRYTAYLIDQRNHGRSPHKDKLDYNSLAEDLHDFIDEHKLENPVLLGHSMGGKTVMQYATRWPDDIRKLIVVDIAPKAYPVHHEKILEGLAAVPLAQLESRQEADDILARHEPSAGVRQFLLKNLYKNESGAFDWRINLPVLTRDMPVIGEEITSAEPVNVPTLFIKGEKSDYILDQDEPQILKLFPDTRFVTIPGAGHWVQAEQPELFLKALKSFLEE